MIFTDPKQIYKTVWLIVTYVNISDGNYHEFPLKHCPLILNHTWGPQGTHKCPGVLIFQPHFFWGNKGACANISGFSASSQFCLSADIFGSQQFGELQMLLMFKVHQRPFFSWNGKLKFCSFSCFSHQTINTSAAMLPSNQLSDFACQERLPDAD